MDLLRTFTSPIFAVTPGAIAAFGCDQWAPINPLARLIIGGSILVSSYVGLTWLLRRSLIEKILYLRKRL